MLNEEERKLREIRTSADFIRYGPEFGPVNINPGTIVVFPGWTRSRFMEILPLLQGKKGIAGILFGRTFFDGGARHIEIVIDGMSVKTSTSLTDDELVGAVNAWSFLNNKLFVENHEILHTVDTRRGFRYWHSIEIKHVSRF